MSHIMIDLETMGQDPGCVIMSIGACTFDPEKPLKDFKPNKQPGHNTFYGVIDMQSCLDLGCHVSGDTMNWWMQQNNAALKALINSPLPVKEVLRSFNAWFRSQGGKYPWSHGSNFDIVLLEEIFRLFQKNGINGKAPWKFYDVRDTRTLFDVTGIQPDRSKGTHHNALDDAINQAEAVIQAYESLKVSKLVNKQKGKSGGKK